MMSYHLGMVGPVATSDFTEFLDLDGATEPRPAGLGGPPVGLLCRELLRRGHRLTIFTVAPDVVSEVVMEGPQLKICMGRYRTRPRDRALDLFAAERRYLAAAIRRERPHVLHAQWTYEFALGAAESEVPFVVTAHDAPLIVLRYQFHAYRMIRVLMAYRALRRSRHVAVVSPYVAAHLHRWRFYARDVEVIPNGLAEEMFSPSRPKPTAQRPPIYATILMGWSGRKNGEAALQAFAQVKQRLPEARLLMLGIGHGPNEQAERWASARGLGQGVDFVGQVPYPRVIELLRHDIDVLVHPALEESHGMVLIEAMAARVPVIGGSRSGAVPWTLDFGRAGLLVDVRSPQSLTGAMLRLGTDPSERNRIAEAGYDSARSRFHVSAVADRYERMYERVLAA